MRALFRTTLLALGTTLCCLAQTAGYPASSVPSAALVAAPGSPYGAGVEPRAAATGDFNGDGLPDLALLDNGNAANNSALTILLATKDGAFVPSPGGPISLGPNYTALVVADFNRDGNLDIATTNAYDVDVWLGNGNGGFALAPKSPIDTTGLGFFGAYLLGVGDFNRDGIPDLLVLTSTDDSDVAILLGNGDGSFAMAQGSPTTIGAAGNDLTVADFNLDGNLDVAITCVPNYQVIVLLGDGTGRLLSDLKGPFSTGSFPLSIVHADVNDDGKPDLVVATETSLTVLLGDGTGGFATQPDIGVAGAYGLHSLAVGDLDGDGKLDLAMANGDSSGLVSNILILLGDGKGGFELAASGPVNSPGTTDAVALADFNNDGRLDLAVSNVDAGTASIFLGAPAATSSPILTSAPNPTVGVPFPVTATVNTSGFRTPTGTVTVQEAATVIGTESLMDGSAIFQTTLGTAGFQALSSTYSGDATTAGSRSPGLTIDLAKGSQTISFPALPRHAYGDPPFAVTASSSSGLPVTLAVISGPATIAGNVVTLTGSGVVTLQASQPGNDNYLPAPNVEQQLQVAVPLLQVDGVVNAASYGGGPFGADSFVAVFGVNLASLSSGSLSPELGGTSVEVKDASGKVSNALLYYASPAQMNVLLPSDLKSGRATMTVQTQTGLSAITTISIAQVGPGFFSADASGTGVAAGSALRVSADGEQTELPISSCSGQPLSCTAIPIDLGTDSDTVYLSLYGTGIRGRSTLAAVTAAIGGRASNVSYAGAQPQFPGLDQVNLQISPKLAGRGSVNVVLKVDGIAANVVTVAIQ